MKRFFTLGMVLGFLVVGTWAWAADTAKIGVVGPRTGPAAATGKAFEEGIALALDTINAKGGVLGKPLEVIFEDTGRGPGKSGLCIRATGYSRKGAYRRRRESFLFSPCRD